MFQDRLPIAALAAALALAAPAAASAAGVPQQVSGTTLSSALSVGVPSPATFGANLGTAGSVNSAGGQIAVTAIGPWTMRLNGSDSGRMRSGAGANCSGSTVLLGNPLDVFATANLGNFDNQAHTTSAPMQVTGTSQPVASGTGSNGVTLTYRYTPAATDQLAAACDYAMTATVDVAAA